jgi:hypothetical protein
VIRSTGPGRLEPVDTSRSTRAGRHLHDASSTRDEGTGDDGRVRSIELTFDPAMEAAFRAEWAALESAGLPNLGRHQQTSNRPHLTLAAGPTLEPSDALLAVFGSRDERSVIAPPVTAPPVAAPSAAAPAGHDPTADALPVDLRVSGLLLFPAGPARFVLARPVVVTMPVLALHRAVHERAPGAVDLTLPGRWTPHVTLARRLSRAQVAEALDVLVDEPPEGSCVAARFWNGETKTLTALTHEAAPLE